MSAKPPTIVSLTWLERLEFRTTFHRGTETIIDSAGVAGPSPVDALGAALAGCMAMDVADILRRGRHPLTSLTARLTAERAQTPPHRFLSVALHFVVGGAVPTEAIDRAIALSRDKYCSVWHSMREDIEFQVTYERV